MSVKFFLKILLIAASLLFSISVNAQEAKLVKQMEWGSGHYEHMVEINGYYYIATSSNQIDVINPNLTGQDSLVGQMSLTHSDRTKIYAFGKFKSFLFVATAERLTIYSISEVTNLEEVYSVAITVHGSGEKPTASQGDYLYYVDSDHKIFILKHDETGFFTEKVIQSPAEIAHSNTVGISFRELFVEGDKLYYLYYLSKGGQRFTYIEQYQLDNYLLVDSGFSEGVIKSEKSILVGNGRFVISNFQRLFLVQLAEGVITILDYFNNEIFNSSPNFAFRDNTLHTLDKYNILRTYHISEQSSVTLAATDDLSSYLEKQEDVNYFNWVNGQLMGLQDDYGAFEIEFQVASDNVDTINFLYNQSGSLGNSVIEDNLIYLPRGARIDVVDTSNSDDMILYSQIPMEVDDIVRSKDNFIFTYDGDSNDSIGNYSLVNSSGFELNSEVAIKSVRGNLVQTNSSLYNISYDKSYLVRKNNVTTAYGLYESADIAALPEQGGFCPEQLSIIDNKLIAFDPCRKSIIHLFSNVDSENFAFQKTIEHGYSYSSAVILGEYIYFINTNGINIVKLNEGDELEYVSFINIDFLGELSYTSIEKAEVLDGYLLVYGSDYFYLLNIEMRNSPVLISKVSTDNWNLWDANIQFEAGYVLVTTKNQGQVKLYQINKAPTASISTLTLNEDEELGPIALFTDPELDTITQVIVQAATNGVATIDDNGLSYTPSENFYGSDAAIIKAEDEHGNYIEHELSITIVPVNDAPIITTESLSTDEDIALITTIQAEDVEQDELSFSLLTPIEPSFGSATITEMGELSYTPNSDFNGNVTFSVTVEDVHGASNTSEVSIIVNPVNDRPDVANQEFTGDEDVTLAEQLAASDIDGDSLSFSMIGAPSSGQLTLEESGMFTYQPYDNFYGVDSFEFAVTDSHGASSTAIARINVSSINDAPIINTSQIQTLEDTELVKLLDITDVEGDQLSYSIAEQASHGAASLSDTGELTYLPSANYYGKDNVKISAIDSYGAAAVTNISIVIESVNDNPVLIGDTFEGEEDMPIEGRLSATDADEHPLSFSVVAGSSANGQVSIQSNGEFVFIPDENFFGQASFIAQVTDIEQGVDQKTIVIEVQGTDDLPVAESSSASVNHNGSISNNLPTTDIDGDSLQYSVVNDVTNGTLTLSSSGYYTYKANAGYVGSDSFTYEVSDGKSSVQGTISFSVKAAPIEDKPNSGGGSVSYLLVMLLIWIYCRRNMQTGRS